MKHPKPPPKATVRFESGQTFQVERVLCIGRNFSAHAAEMGADARAAPCWFSKWPRCVISGSDLRLPFPPRTTDLQPEVELVVAISGGGARLTLAQALGAVHGYGVGLDMTRRDLQRMAKENRHPWDSGKSFENAAPVGLFRQLPVPPTGRIQLAVNGETRQDASLLQMVWSVPELLAELSTYGPLHPGDLVFTGTPAGVGPVVCGDLIEASVRGLPALNVTITGPS